MARNRPGRGLFGGSPGAVAAADPDEWDDDDEPVDLEPEGHPSSIGDEGRSGLADFILELAMGLTKLGMLLTEADEDDWRALGGRLALLQKSAEAIPGGPRPKRRVGFRAPEKPIRKRAGKRATVA